MSTQATTHRRETSRPAGLVARPEDLVWFDGIEGERSALHVTGRQSGGAFGIIESVVAPGTAVPRHHHREDELFFIIEGVATIEVDGVIDRAGPGATILIPGGVPHAWKNATRWPLRMLATFTPGGVETMFPLFAGKPMPEIVAIAESYGTHVVGPPIA